MYFCFFLWSLSQPVKIIDVHRRGHGFSAILVDSFPVTDAGKINWWLKNKSFLESHYHIPLPERNGFFYITFWLFGDGYKEQGKKDRMCFDDMDTIVNCIDKKAVMTVDNSKNMGLVFTIYDGGTYRLDKQGKIVKMPD